MLSFRKFVSAFCSVQFSAIHELTGRVYVALNLCRNDMFACDLFSVVLLVPGMQAVSVCCVMFAVNGECMSGKPKNVRKLIRSHMLEKNLLGILFIANFIFEAVPVC